MKHLFFLLSFFYTFYIEAQSSERSGKVMYEESFGSIEKNNFEMNFCGSESVYQQYFIYVKGQTVQTIAGFIEPQIKMIYYYNAVDKKILFQEGIAFKTIIVEEDQTSIDWIITDEVKKIGDYSCQKATATFKGNVYNAWFATEIPVPFGPWKLHGLPGLILECSDASNFYVLKATKIDLSVSCDIVKKLNKNDTFKNPISMKQYKVLRQNENEEIFNFYNSISSRDTFLEIETDYTGFMREPIK